MAKKKQLFLVNYFPLNSSKQEHVTVEATSALNAAIQLKSELHNVRSFVVLTWSTLTKEG